MWRFELVVQCSPDRPVIKPARHMMAVLSPVTALCRDPACAQHRYAALVDGSLNPSLEYFILQ